MSLMCDEPIMGSLLEKEINLCIDHYTVYLKWSGHTVAIHNGKEYLSIYVSVTDRMVGHKFIEFIATLSFQ